MIRWHDWTPPVRRAAFVTGTALAIVVVVGLAALALVALALHLAERSDW